MICFAIILLLCASPAARAAGTGEADGALTDQMIEALRSSCPLEGDTKLRHHALAGNDIKKIALNRSLYTATDPYFTDQIEIKGITDQQKTGRCWLFAGYNILRPGVQEKLNIEKFELSQSYGQFWDKLEKANLFLESVIRTAGLDIQDRKVEWLLKRPFPDGGQWNMVVALCDKYGVVPKEIMPETNSSANTATMNRLITRKLRQGALALRALAAAGKPDAAFEAKKLDILKDVYRMLVLHLGEPPAEFTWRYEDKDKKISEAKTYTPVQFYREVVGRDLSDYVCLYHCPAHPLNALYQIELDRNLFDRENMTFINTGIQDLKDLAVAQLLDNEGVWFGCDVGKDLYSDKGFMAAGMYDYEALYGVDLTLGKEDRIRSHDSVPTHAMVIIGVDRPGDEPAKWLIENSWGDERGDDGKYTMTDPWFDEYVFAVIVNKKYLPERLAKILETEPTILPPWDPMYSLVPGH
jgi:bleomycin hydrolase